MSRRKIEAVPRDFLERVAQIVGPHSAAQQILNEADAWEGGARFWLDRKAGAFILERMPPAARPSSKEGEP